MEQQSLLHARKILSLAYLTDLLPANSRCVPLPLPHCGTVHTGYPGVYTVEYRVTFTDRDEKNPDFDRKYTGYSKLIVVVEG